MEIWGDKAEKHASKWGPHGSSHIWKYKTKCKMQMNTS